MDVELIKPDDVVLTSVDVLGLDADAVDFTSIEVLAASLRRAASFLCPVAPGLLVRTVDDALARLPGYSDETRALLSTTLDALVLYGDLLELPTEEEGGRRRRLYLGPPAFVERDSGSFLLLGIRPDGAPLVSGGLASLIDYDGHVRQLRMPDVSAELLREEGLVGLQADQWMQAPSARPASDLVADYAARVAASPPAGHLDGVRVLEPNKDPTYYRGRWRELSPVHSGSFVARRPQGYGADLWCYLEVVGGEAARGIDLPVHAAVAPGADEAWRLQAAIDATNGTPQRFAHRSAQREGWSVLDLFSPVPSWAQRRLDVVGKPSVRSAGALLTYAVPTAEVDEEMRFLQTMMWMSSTSSGGSDG